MLDRAPQETQDEAKPRPVAFRGAGFTPSAGRYSGWIALALVIAFWQLAGSAGWVNALFLPRAFGDRRSRSTSSRCRARSGSICPGR